MEFSFNTRVNASKQAVWEYYADVQKWYEWESDLKNITLENGFKKGSIGIMELQGMPPIKYLLTDVNEAQAFWDKADTPMGSVYFGHEIFENADGSVNIKHTVKLESDDISEKELNFLKQVFSGVPHSVFSLKQKVEMQ